MFAIFVIFPKDFGITALAITSHRADENSNISAAQGGWIRSLPQGTPQGAYRGNRENDPSDRPQTGGYIGNIYGK